MNKNKNLVYKYKKIPWYHMHVVRTVRNSYSLSEDMKGDTIENEDALFNQICRVLSTFFYF